MAPRKTPAEIRAEKDRIRDERNGIFTFDVTCVVGTVRVGPGGDESPHIVAMKLIAEHDAEGTYTFPMPDGRVQRVTIEFTDPHGVMPERDIDAFDS